MVLIKKIVLDKYFNGLPKISDFQLVQEELPDIKDGEFLAEAKYISVDPYVRAYAYKVPLDTVLPGMQIAKIVESKHTDFPVGQYVLAKFNWVTHTISNGYTGEPNQPASIPPFILPDFEGLPKSLGLGVLGLTGYFTILYKIKHIRYRHFRITAYFGFLEYCKPREGETVVVSGAAGAVGSHVGQIARIKGCRVIGITGSNEKGNYLTNKLGFHAYINYKTENIDSRLSEIAPEGVDCYFDNVAGEISTTVMQHMNTGGRVSVCGSISSYNHDINDLPKVTVVQPFIAEKQLILEGFQSYLFYDRKFEAINQNLQWIKQGELKYVETVTKGFESLPRAFIEMLEGRNIGKAIVKV